MGEISEREQMEADMENIRVSIKAALHAVAQFRKEYAPKRRQMTELEFHLEQARALILGEMSEAGIIPF